MLTRALQLVGLLPIATLGAYRVVSVALNTRSWQLLLPTAHRPSFARLLRLRWIGEAINGLLPVGQVGGDVARARLVARDVGAPGAAASLLVDLGTGIVTQAVFGVLAALAFARSWRPLGASRGAEVVGGAVLSALALVAIVAALRLGAIGAIRWSARFLVARGRRRWTDLAGSLERLDLAVVALLARKRQLAAAAGWHLAGWLSQVGETWIALTLFGARVSWTGALAIEGLSSAARGAAFFVPGGLGVQEVTVVSLARALGVEPEPALALGIAKRAREIVVGAPGLLAWALDERRSWARRNNRG